MPIQRIHTFLVHPQKGLATATQLNGSSVPLNGKMFDLLRDIYDKSETDCDIDIQFVSNHGVQQNDCRDLVCSYLQTPSLANGRAIAKRLSQHTDGRSGLGLLFLISGTEGRDQKIVLSRFPTDNAIQVDENSANLTVQFLERVFMKNKSSYKAVMYQHASVRSGFWSGHAIDRQINSPATQTSNYWIVDFLASEFTVTPAAGTRRLAVALRTAANEAPLDIKKEIVAVATLTAGLGNRRLSGEEFCNHFGLSDEAKGAVLKGFKNSRSAQERFAFDLSEFRSVLTFKSVELDTGAIVTAPSDKFDEVFQQQAIRGQSAVRFTTQGQIVNEKLKTNA